jgi:hypothetical protein
MINMKTMNYTVMVKEMIETAGGSIISNVPIKDVQVSTKKLAIATAKEWAKQNPRKYVFISHFESHDSQQSYLNPNGFDVVGHDWAEEYKNLNLGN